MLGHNRNGRRRMLGGDAQGYGVTHLFMVPAVRGGPSRSWGARSIARIHARREIGRLWRTAIRARPANLDLHGADGRRPQPGGGPARCLASIRR